MQKLKSFFKALLILFLVLLVSVVTVAIYALGHPRQTWTLIQNHFLPKDLKITWQDFNFHVDPVSSRDWKIQWASKNLCLTKNRPQIDFCFDDLNTQAELSLRNLKNPELTIQELSAHSSHLNYFLSSQENKTQKSESDFYEMFKAWRERLQKYASLVRIEKLDLQVDHFELRSEQSLPLVFGASLKAESFLDQATFDVQMQKGKDLMAHAQGTMWLRHLFNKEENFLSVRAKFEFSKKQVRLNDLTLGVDGNSKVTAKAQVLAKKSSWVVENNLDSTLTASLYSGRIRTTVRGLKKPFENLQPINLSFRLPQEKGQLWARSPAELSLNAFLPVFFVDSKMRSELQKTCNCVIPEELLLTGQAQIRLHEYFQKKDGELVAAQAHLQNLTNSLFSTETQASAKVFRRQGRFEIAPQIDSKTTLNSFQGLVTFFKSQKILMPAPLNSLDGKIRLLVQGPVEKSVELWKIPYQVVTDLASEDQKLKTETRGFVQVAPNSHAIQASVKLFVHDLALQLPPLDPIYGLPKIFPDRRFEIHPPPELQKKKPNPWKFTLALDIKTERPDSIRLFYPLAKPAIPLAMNVHYRSGSATEGEVEASTFQVDYLKRRATIERLQVDLNEPKGTFPVQGRFRVDQEPYKIYIDILGTLKSPQIVLSSDPYLDRSDIISVLLYGRTNDQLVAIDSKTVGSFDAAMADRAIGILGLWAFASTPIQSFSYNQLTGQYSAQLKLSNDTTLAVGTNWEEASSLELQKRLSDRWIISASLEPNEADQETRKIRLQWEDRF